LEKKYATGKARTTFYNKHAMAKHEADSLENVAKKLKQDMDTDQKPGTLTKQLHSIRHNINIKLAAFRSTRT
jgi:hypothetical protein